MSDLMKMLPNYYKSSAVMKCIITAIQNETERLREYTNQLNSDFCIDTATEDSIKLWEDSHAVIPKYTELDKRRKVVKARIRSTKTGTEKDVINLILSYTGEAEIKFDYENSIMRITITDTYGIPKNNEDIIKAIETYKPAHFDYTLTYRYITWAAAAAVYGDYDTAKELTWYDMASHASTEQEVFTNGRNK